MNADLELTAAGVASHGWQVVLLGGRSKKPTGPHWRITKDADLMRRHVSRGGNVGLVCGPDSGVAVIDGDDVALMKDMSGALGALAIWVETGSGKFHCYVRWEPNLPAKISWQGRRVGEVQRGPRDVDSRNLQHVVLPPSTHPGTGRPYQWRIDPRLPVPALRETWRAHLIPSAVKPDDSCGPLLGAQPGAILRRRSFSKAHRIDASHNDETAWEGPPAEELLRRAMEQPGARGRAIGVKFQCPGCRAEGHDRHMDNALVRLDGRWGCAVDSEHSRTIGKALGVVESAVAGYDERVLRRLGLRPWA